MSSHRHFKVIGGDLCSSRAPEQIGTPHAIVGVLLRLEDEQLLRLFQRVYELGRRDQAEDIRFALGFRS